MIQICTMVFWGTYYGTTMVTFDRGNPKNSEIAHHSCMVGQNFVQKMQFA